MPLSNPTARREVHHRVIDMKVYERDGEGGLYDIEVHLVDRKSFDVTRLNGSVRAAGEPLHDLWVRMTVDTGFMVHAIEAASDITPWELCRQAETTLQVVVGERIERGWSAMLKLRLRGTASCTHLLEMLVPAATAAMQGVRGVDMAARRRETRSDGTPAQIDTCLAYDRRGAVVARIWPEHHRPPAPAD